MKKQAPQKADAARARIWKLLCRLLTPIWVRAKQYHFDPITLQGPYLLIANHASNSDPILMGLASPGQPLAVVGSEHLERLGFLTRLLNRCFHLIPRSKGSSGVGTVKAILKTIRQGRPVLLFAEGECSWDGVSIPVFSATGKLAKHTGVPLVTYRLQGNYLAKPRWAKRSRRFPIRGSMVRIYSPEELDAMSPDEVNRAINRDICEDAWQTAAQTKAETFARASAAGLEQALFLCPSCGGIGTLRGRGSIFSCCCGFSAPMDRAGLFTAGPFCTIRDWDRWQQDAMDKLVCQGEKSGLFPAEGWLTRFSGNERQRVRFCLNLRDQTIEITGKPVPFSEISGIAMVKTNRLLFTVNGDYCEIYAKKAVLRPYLLAVQAAQREKER